MTSAVSERSRARTSSSRRAAEARARFAGSISVILLTGGARRHLLIASIILVVVVVVVALHLTGVIGARAAWAHGLAGFRLETPPEDPDGTLASVSLRSVVRRRTRRGSSRW